MIDVDIGQVVVVHLFMESSSMMK